MLATAAATLALLGARRAHARVARAFGAAGLAVMRDRFAVPGKGRSRNVIGAVRRPADCLWILMAHADTVPPSPGAEDNASGVARSDHRELGLAGLTAAKLGVPDKPLRHTAADTARRLHPGTFPRVQRLLAALLQAAG